MAVSKELLEYQKVDAELRKIEQEISQSDERKKYVQAKKFMETAAEKLEAMDARARELKEMAMRLTFNYQELNKAISEYAGIDEMVEAGGDVAFYKKKVQTLSDQLRSLKNELNKLVSEIENACEEYQRMKKQTISMQKQYKEYNEKFKEVKAPSSCRSRTGAASAAWTLRSPSRARSRAETSSNASTAIGLFIKNKSSRHFFCFAKQMP